MTKKIYGLENIEQQKANVKKRVLKSVQTTKQKKWVLYPVTLLVVIAFAGFLYFQIQQSSSKQATETSLNDEILFEVRPLTNDEFDKVGATNSIIEVTKNDFRVVHFKYELQKDKNITLLQMELSHYWKEIFRKIDGIDRYWFGSYSEQNNDTAPFSEFEATMTVFVRGLSEQMLQQHFQNYTLELAWQVGTEKEVKEIILANYITFKGNSFLTEQAKVVGPYDKPLSTDFVDIPAYEIGANQQGMPVFVNMEAAFEQAKVDYKEAFEVINSTARLGKVSTTNWQHYKKLGFDLQTSDEKLNKQASELAMFFDIYENSLK